MFNPTHLSIHMGQCASSTAIPISTLFNDDLPREIYLTLEVSGLHLRGRDLSERKSGVYVFNRLGDGEGKGGLVEVGRGHEHRLVVGHNQNRRLAKDFEATIASAEAWLFLASVQLITRSLPRA